jgi:hypothetical protein
MRGAAEEPAATRVSTQEMGRRVHEQLNEIIDRRQALHAV